VDGGDVLRRLVRDVPISTWRYRGPPPPADPSPAAAPEGGEERKEEEPAARHMGPMAQVGVEEWGGCVRACVRA
jgi:hypothetical protein